MAISLRGTGQQASSASSYTVAWPSGTVAGDFAVILCGHAWGANAPSGWTQNDNQTGSNWNGAVFSKILSAADITAGSVSVGFSGSFDGTVAILTTIGVAAVTKVDATRNGSGSSSISITSTAAPATSDLFVYFGSNRGASTDTVNRGTLQRQVNDGANASGCLYTESLSSAPTAIFSYSVAGSGNYQAIVDLGPPPVPISSVITAPIVNAGAGARHQLVKAPASVSLTPTALSPAPVAQVIQGGTLNVPYSETITTAGGTSPYTYSVVSGTLPTGTSLNSSSGVISGTPTIIGTYTFTVKSVDANSYSGQQAFSVTISAPQVSNYGYVA